MSGDQSRSTVEIAKFTIDNTETEKVPFKNGERCRVKETNLNCDAVLTLLDKKKSVNDETLFSLSINNYDSRINDEMKNSLENYKNVIYYNSQLKKFYSSYENDDDKKTVKENISHILILGKKDVLFKSGGIYTFDIDKTILIYEDSNLTITSANEPKPDLTRYEYFNLIYIDWFSLLLTDFEKEFKKAYPDVQEYENDFENDSSTGGRTPRTTTDDILEEEGLINQIRINQIDENAATELQAAARAKLAANKEEKRRMLLKRYSDEEKERKEAIITQKLLNRGNIIMENGRGASSIGGKKRVRKQKS